MQTGPGGKQLVVHVPHASIVIPSEEAEYYLLSTDQLTTEARAMADLYTDRLFQHDAAIQVVAPVCRLVVDVERFEDDSLEPMAAVGMGITYTSTHDGSPLRGPLTPQRRAALIDRWYRPHHEALEREVDRVLRLLGAALVVDAHSFPSKPLPYERDQRQDRPEICLGTDDYHTPGPLAESTLAWFAGTGFTVALNRPFAGSLVPARYYRKSKQVASIMIEVRRDLYLEERTGEPSPGFETIRERIGSYLGWLSDNWRRLVARGNTDGGR